MEDIGKTIALIKAFGGGGNSNNIIFEELDMNSHGDLTSRHTWNELYSAALDGFVIGHTELYTDDSEESQGILCLPLICIAHDTTNGYYADFINYVDSTHLIRLTSPSGPNDIVTNGTTPK